MVRSSASTVALSKSQQEALDHQRSRPLSQTDRAHQPPGQAMESLTWTTLSRNSDTKDTATSFAIRVSTLKALSSSATATAQLNDICSWRHDALKRV